MRQRCLSLNSLAIFGVRQMSTDPRDLMPMLRIAPWHGLIFFPRQR